MLTLAREQRKRMPVVIGTTTKIMRPSSDDVDSIVFECEDFVPNILSHAAHDKVICLAKSESKGKLCGVSRDVFEGLSRSLHGLVIVEADGSRQLPLKAPRDHEHSHSIPSNASIVVAVVGVWALGTVLCEDNVMGADLVCGMSGRTIGSVVDPQTVASVVNHPQGSFKGAPDRAKKVLIVNGALDGEETLIEAIEIGKRVQGDVKVVYASIKKGRWN